MTIANRAPSRCLFRGIVAAALFTVMLSLAQAHLMVAQRGTLNIVDSGAFLVLSAPVSAFDDIDDNGDGQLSMIEFNLHRDELEAAVVERVKLLDEEGPRPLQGIMLAPSIPDNEPLGAAQHLIVMGRFALSDATAPLRFDVDLFGTDEAEQRFSVTATRKATDQKSTMILTVDDSVQSLFPSSMSVFMDFMKLGAVHIFEGLDHLLFLLVVLASGWSLRQVVGALTAFTVGHAITLSLVYYSGLSVSGAVVEPAIAATIVGMALFDMRTRRTNKHPPPWVRLSLVFGCSLIHGLGLSGALNDMGLDRQYQLPSLAGFNMGIEGAQLLIAFAVAAFVLLFSRLFGRSTVTAAARVSSYAALTIGAAWFVQRVISVA